MENKGQNPKHSFSLRTKLSLSYIFLAFVLIGIISLLSNILLEKQFIKYVQTEQENRNKEIVSIITEQYHKDGSFDEEFYHYMFTNAIYEGLIITLKTPDGNVVCDAQDIDGGMCDMMKAEIEATMNNFYPEMQGEFIENSYDIKDGDEIVGTVTISSYGPFYINENAILFINTLNRIFIVIAFVSLLIAVFIGFFMSNRIAKPILKVIGMAGEIGKGNYEKTIKDNTSTKEINQLIITVNGLNKTLKEQKELRKRLTADVAHELRTPIATLQSHMETIIDGVWEPTTERLISCHEEIIRLGNMVSDLNKLDKIENEPMSINKTIFNLSLLITKAVHFFEADMNNKNITISSNLQEVEINADKERIFQVLVNLLSNAIKYTDNGGKIFIEVRGNEKQAIIVIKDTGIGISDEDLPHIFERLYRADKSRGRLTGGLGIGLAIVKAIVIEHEGNVSATSGLGIGTTFTVVLPK